MTDALHFLLETVLHRELCLVSYLFPLHHKSVTRVGGPGLLPTQALQSRVTGHFCAALIGLWSVLESPKKSRWLLLYSSCILRSDTHTSQQFLTSPLTAPRVISNKTIQGQQRAQLNRGICSQVPPALFVDQTGLELRSTCLSQLLGLKTCATLRAKRLELASSAFAVQIGHTAFVHL